MSNADPDLDDDADGGVGGEGASEVPDAIDGAVEEQLKDAKAVMGATSEDERPSPTEVQSATKEDVLNLRDDGELVTDAKTVETSEGWRTVEMKRPSATLIQWFESLGDDIDTDEFGDIYARMVADPDLTPDEWRQGDLTMYVDLIPIALRRMEAVMQSEFVENTAAAIEEHSDESAGN